MFTLYLKLGFFHIISLDAYDHILFVTLLTGIYHYRQWKNILALVTAFTSGHSLSLALSTLHIVVVSSAVIEWFIVITIFLTGVENLFIKTSKDTRIFSIKYWIKYSIAMLFGLVHGLGFSFYLQSMLGREESIILPLLSFNIGVELAQWIVVAIIFFVTWLMVDKLKILRKEWNLVLSCTGIGIALILIFERYPF